MELTKKAYHTPDALGFAFRAAPVCTALHLLLSAVHAIMPTAAMALATANFVDAATVVLQGAALTGISISRLPCFSLRSGYKRRSARSSSLSAPGSKRIFRLY